MASEVEQVRNLEIQSAEPRRMRQAHGTAIAELERSHYSNVFRAIPGFDLDEIVAVEQPRSWDNPNRAEGESLRSNARVFVATEEGELAGFAYVADDASSQRDGTAATLEKRAKMLLPQLGARYTWIREMLARGDEARQTLVYDALLYAVLLGKRDDQKVTIYPDEREKGLMQYAASRGFEPTDVQVKSFAPNSPRGWKLIRHEAPSSDAVKDRIKTERRAQFIAHILQKRTD